MKSKCPSHIGNHYYLRKAILTPKKWEGHNPREKELFPIKEQLKNNMCIYFSFLYHPLVFTSIVYTPFMNEVLLVQEIHQRTKQ